MTRIFDSREPADLLAGTRQARAAVSRGGLIVIPTDTVYGIAADAFNPDAVRALLAAKGRTRQQPPPVLIPNLATLDALAETVPDTLRSALAVLWPGALTVVLPAMPSLVWDLGETRGTVALRMPDHPLALELLSETGPLAVSSANRTGQPPARTAADAEQALGESVAVYLEAGLSSQAPASTIVDAVSWVRGQGPLRILRSGGLGAEELTEAFGERVLEEGAPGETMPGEAGHGEAGHGEAVHGEAGHGTAAPGEREPRTAAPDEDGA